MSDPLEKIAAGVEALQQDQTRRNIENEISADPLNDVFSPREKAAIKKLVHEALAEFFKEYGVFGGNLLYTGAKIVGALIVIFGGIKLFLLWIGFSYTK